MNYRRLVGVIAHSPITYRVYIEVLYIDININIDIHSGRGVLIALSSRPPRGGTGSLRRFSRAFSASAPLFFILPELRSAKRINHVPFEAFLAGFSRKPRGVINGRWIIHPWRKARRHRYAVTIRTRRELLATRDRFAL